MGNTFSYLSCILPFLCLFLVYKFNVVKFIILLSYEFCFVYLTLPTSDIIR